MRSIRDDFQEKSKERRLNRSISARSENWSSLRRNSISREDLPKPHQRLGDWQKIILKNTVLAAT